MVARLMETLLRKTPFSTRVEGQTVVMTIGTKEVRMEYAVALKLSAFLRHSGRQAKRAAGDDRRIWTGIAELTDANIDELEAQRSRDGTAVFSK
jgi:hypothetical protein